MRSFVGYHGTTAMAAQSIVRTGTFVATHNPDHWLGPGVYFFEDDIRQAVNWCVKVRRFRTWSIVRCSIIAEKVIDLLKIDDLEEFRKIARTVVSQYRKLHEGKVPKLITSDVLNVIYEVRGYDVVRHAFAIPNAYAVQYTNVVPMEIQICVRNQASIKTIDEVQYEP